MVNIFGYNKINKSKLIYPNVLSAILSELSAPVSSETFKTISNHDISVDSNN